MLMWFGAVSLKMIFLCQGSRQHYTQSKCLSIEQCPDSAGNGDRIGYLRDDDVTRTRYLCTERS
jgi:hypothetical protein